MALTVPNLRRIFIPDPGFAMADCDLAGADAQVVAWEADDPTLKQMFKEKVALHLENMKIVFPGSPPIKSNNPNSPYHRAKQGVHATNYVGSAKGVAKAINITVHEADIFQKRWFGAHPQIKVWHDRIQDSLNRTRSVWNQFGYRRFYFDRIEKILPEAVAWIPQSTVAIVTNRGLKAIDKWTCEGGPVQLLLQTHDSLTLQFPKRNNSTQEIVDAIRERMEITIPYPDPLVIPITIKMSTSSWGECDEAA